MEKKKAQTTIFIILALVIVVVLVLLYINRASFTSVLSGKSPIENLKQCIRDSMQEGIEIISVQGGSISPENYYLYENNKVDYLCYSDEYYKKCIMQKPLLKQSIEKELKEYSKTKIQGCLDSAKNSLEKEGYIVSAKDANISIEIIPNNIIVNVEADLETTKQKTESYKFIKTDINSDLYNLIMIAGSISNFEARYGDSETMTYMMYYPALKVEKKKQAEGTTIYVLTNRETLDKFIFASKSVVFPPGVRVPQ